MKLVDVDALQAQALEAAFNSLLEVRGAGVVLPNAGPVARPSGFGCDDETGRIGIERLSNQLFRDIGTVGVCGINEIDAELDGAAKRGERRIDIGWRTPDALAR